MIDGDEVRVKVPVGALDANPFSNYHVDWRSWIIKINGCKVVLDYQTESDRINGWYVISVIEPDEGDTSRWIPNTWLVELDTCGIGYCVACGGVRKHRLMCPVEMATSYED